LKAFSASGVKTYAAAAAFAALGYAVTWATAGLLGGAMFMFQFAAVVPAALYGGFGPGLFTAALSGVAFFVAFQAPALESHEAWRLVSFAVVSVLFAWFAATLRRAGARERAARERAELAQRKAEVAEAEATAIGAHQERLVAMVSHDLRNPLNAVAMSVRLLENHAALDPRQVRTLARIASSAGRMETMVRDLLDFARGRHGAGIPVHPERARLGEICRRAVEELRAAHPDRSVLVAVEGDDAAWVDPDRVEQVVGNLVSNALKHGRADRPIVVAVTGGPAGPLRLEVRNEGPAIPRQLLPTLFDAFRAGDAPGSVGLGLFIVREIALAHGGTASASSDERETRFVVTFPRGDAAAGALPEAAA
jgi:signal transduction histidine kinase